MPVIVGPCWGSVADISFQSVSAFQWTKFQFRSVSVSESQGGLRLVQFQFSEVVLSFSLSSVLSFSRCFQCSVSGCFVMGSVIAVLSVSMFNGFSVL